MHFYPVQRVYFNNSQQKICICAGKNNFNYKIFKFCFPGMDKTRLRDPFILKSYLNKKIDNHSSPFYIRTDLGTDGRTSEQF